MKIRWISVWVVGLVLLAPGLASAAEPVLSARFDRQRVFEGDSVVLKVELSNARLEAEPDSGSLACGLFYLPSAALRLCVKSRLAPNDSPG